MSDSDKHPPPYSAPHSNPHSAPYSAPPPGSQPYPPPPQASYYNASTGVTAQQPTVVYTQPIVISGTHFGECPVRTKCPQCQADVLTSTHYETGGFAWMIFGMLAIAGCFVIVTWFFCCIPFCLDSCKDVVHTCPNCHAVIGRKNRI